MDGFLMNEIISLLRFKVIKPWFCGGADVHQQFFWTLKWIMSLFVDALYSASFQWKKKPHIFVAAVWLAVTHYRRIPGSCQTWRGTLRGLSQTTTANIWRTGKRRTLSGGWWTTRGVGQCFLHVHGFFLFFFLKTCLCLHFSEKSSKNNLI